MRGLSGLEVCKMVLRGFPIRFRSGGLVTCVQVPVHRLRRVDDESDVPQIDHSPRE